MKGFVSSRRLGFVALITSIPIVWLACSMLVPSGDPWMGITWTGLALSAAVWLEMRSIPSLAHVLDFVGAAPIPAVAVRSRPIRSEAASIPREVR